MHELLVDVAYNADRTPTTFKNIPKTTVASKGVITVWVRTSGKDKNRVSCMLLGDSFGRKYSPFLVLKSLASKIVATAADNREHQHGFGKRLWKEVKGLQSKHGVQMYGNRTSWWNRLVGSLP